MKALVYEGPGRKALVERPKPQIQAPTDAVVRVTKTTICGTDLHILKGDVPTCRPGTILGHEGVGVVESVGPAVRKFRPGDKVLMSCITACGACDYCRRGMYSHCRDGGWILGHRIDGTQADYVRIPHADHSLHRIPPGLDEEALVMLSDIFPTGFECGALNGEVERPNANVAIVGAGPIGLATLLTAKLFAPARVIMIDPNPNRLAVARDLGATHTLSGAAPEIVTAVMKLTDGKGADSVIEAVGTPAAFELCEELVAPGGVIANIGVHGEKADLHLERLWSHNITIRTRLVDTVTTDRLINAVADKKLDPLQLITHRFPLERVMDAYDTFARAADTHALKVILAPAG
jgi:alcohol dehydrogenase